MTPSESPLCSPRYSITIADDSIPPEVERDFFSQLYGGDTPGYKTNNFGLELTEILLKDAGNIPEEYYSYLENWYRSQISAHNMDIKNSGSAPALHTSLTSPFSLQQVLPTNTSSVQSSTSSVTSPSSSFSPSVFIPVSALQNLRASLPGGLQSAGKITK